MVNGRQSRSKILRAQLMHASGKGVVLSPVHPNAGVQFWYQSQLDQLISEMHADLQRFIVPAVKAVPQMFATDADARQAAGIIFRSPLDKVLILLRRDGFWGIPGGGREPGETLEQCARRETREETCIDPFERLFFNCAHQHRDVIFTTFTTYTDVQWKPILNHEHSDYAWVHVDEALDLPNLHPGLRYALLWSQSAAFDAQPVNIKQLERQLDKWGRQWIKRFDVMSLKISLDFATRSKNATEVAVKSALAKQGFTVPFRPTKASVEAYKIIAAEQVGLIKSIAQKYHTDVQSSVWESVKRGGDLKTLSKQLQKTYGVTKKRAALIARDQNAKAKATIERVRHQEMGIRQAIWMHSHGGKEPRPSHVKMNNKLYDLAKGMYDPDEGKYIHPGELINCRCTMRPYIPGFEAAYPEWEITQT